MANIPPISFQSLSAYLKGLPESTLIREVWHTHNREHYGKQIGTEWLPQRAAEYLRILDVIQPRRKQSDSYAPKWLPIPNDPEMINSYAKLFYEFNCFLSLNYYAHAYGLKKAELFQAQQRLRQMKSMPKTFVPQRIKEQDERLLELQRQLNRDCYMDLAFDFDVGETCELKTIPDAIGKVQLLLDWLENAEAPYELYFSGSRGFHVVVPYQSFEQTMQTQNHRIHEQLLSMIELQTGRLGVDRSIFSARKQLRLVNTRHSKSLLFKIQISRDDLKKGQPHILTMAETKQPFVPAERGISQILKSQYLEASEVTFNESKRPVKPENTARLKHTFGHDLTKPGTGEPLLQFNQLNHPACISQALQYGVMNRIKANRNQVTLLLANYFKLIGREVEETKQVLSQHATTILAPFSGSSLDAIKASTRGAVQTVFHDDKYFFTCSRARSLGFDCDSECVNNESYVGTSSERSLTTVPYQVPDPKNQEDVYDSVEDIRPVIYETIQAYITECENNPAKQYPPLIIKAPPGSGKTTQAYHFIAKSGKRSMMVASQYDLFDNIPKKLREDWLRIMGRHGGVWIENESQWIEAYCSIYSIARKFGNKNYNVFQKVCQDCKDYKENNCVYFFQFEDPESNWFIQQPTFIHKVENIIPLFHYVFMDESCLAAFITTTEITGVMVQEVSDFLKNMMEFWDYYEDDDEFRQVDFLLAFLRIFISMLNDDLLPSGLSGGLLYQHMDLRYQSMFSIDNGYPETFESLIAEIDPGWRNVLNEKTQLDVDIPDKKLPHNFLPDLFQVLEEDIHYERSPDIIGRLRLKRDQYQMKMLLSIKHDPPPLSRPIVVLDATAKADVYQRLFNHRVTLFEPKLSYQNPIIQLYSTYAGVASLESNKQQFKNMLEGLKELLIKEPATLIICKKRFEKRIRKMGLPKETQITHFYGTRGSNEFQSAKQVVIFGAPGWNKDTLFAYAAALYPGEKLSSKQWFPLRQYYGTDKAIRVREYVDPRIQMLYEMSIIDEIIQSLNRIRPLIFGDKMIYLMTNVVIPGLPISQLMSLSELRNIATNKESLISQFVDDSIQKNGYVIKTDIQIAFPDIHRNTIDKYFKQSANNENYELLTCHVVKSSNGSITSVLHHRKLNDTEVMKRIMLRKSLNISQIRVHK